MINNNIYNKKQFSIFNIQITNSTLDQFLELLVCFINQKEKVSVGYINIHAMNLIYKNPSMRKYITNCDLSFCDGVGIKIAALLTNQPIPDRFTPPDFIEEICALSERNNWRLFFLGAKPGIAQKAAQKLQQKFPTLIIQTHHGYFNKNKDNFENQQLISIINEFEPHILIVGFGMPTQEMWIQENKDEIRANIFFPAGALFDYITGNVIRAPRWMTDHGLEWLGRLIIEPQRLWKRYILGNPLFFWRVFIHNVLKYPLPY